MSIKIKYKVIDFIRINLCLYINIKTDNIEKIHKKWIIILYNMFIILIVAKTFYKMGKQTRTQYARKAAREAREAEHEARKACKARNAEREAREAEHEARKARNAERKAREAREAEREARINAFYKAERERKAARKAEREARIKAFDEAAKAYNTANFVFYDKNKSSIAGCCGAFSNKFTIDCVDVFHILFQNAGVSPSNVIQALVTLRNSFFTGESMNTIIENKNILLTIVRMIQKESEYSKYINTFFSRKGVEYVSPEDIILYNEISYNENSSAFLLGLQRLRLVSTENFEIIGNLDMRYLLAQYTKKLQ